MDATGHRVDCSVFRQVSIWRNVERGQASRRSATDVARLIQTVERVGVLVKGEPTRELAAGLQTLSNDEMTCVRIELKLVDSAGVMGSIEHERVPEGRRPQEKQRQEVFHFPGVVYRLVDYYPWSLTELSIDDILKDGTPAPPPIWGSGSFILSEHP